MNNNEPFVELINVDKKYKTGADSVVVLSGLNLIIQRKQTISVVGASGVGKSTLLHLIGALDKPTIGKILLDGVDINSQNEKALAYIRNHRIGFVFQFHHLLPEFDALENTAMPALIAKMDKDEAWGRAEKILKRVGLGLRLKHRVGELSGGEQQRVAVARALVLEPELLLADEPTGNLDSKTGRNINELLLELNEEKGLTSVVVTHNLELAKMMSRQIRLVEGRTVEER